MATIDHLILERLEQGFDAYHNGRNESTSMIYAASEALKIFQNEGVVEEEILYALCCAAEEPVVHVKQDVWRGIRKHVLNVLAVMSLDPDMKVKIISYRTAAAL